MSFTVAGTNIGLTLGQFCDRLLEEHLERSERRELDQLDGAVTSTTTSIVTTHSATGIKPQARIEIDNELMHVWSHTTSTLTSIVARGHGGSTAAAHDDDAIVRVNPRFPRQVLAETLRREVRSWPSTVYALASAEFSVLSTTEAIDLAGLAATDQVRRALRVQRRHWDTTDGSWPLVDAHLERRQNTTDFASGWALRFPNGFDKATDVRVTLGLDFRVPAVLDFTDDLGEDWLLTPGLVDAALFGVAAMLLPGEEVARADQWNQARPRKGEDVPPGYGLQLGGALRQQRDLLLKAEAERLYNAYAPRTR